MTTSNINPALATVAATVGEDLKAFRSASVTGENKGNQSARSLLASLVAGVYTPALATAAIIHAFGNPKGKGGKPIEKLSGLRAFTGGDAVRKAASTVFGIFENIDADATVIETADGNVGAAIRPLVVGFILNEEGAPKSLRALSEGVSAALRSYVAATAPVADEAEPNGDAGGDATAPVTQSLNERVLAVMVAYEAATPEAKLEAHDALAMLWEMVNADIASEEAEPVKLAA